MKAISILVSNADNRGVCYLAQGPIGLCNGRILSANFTDGPSYPAVGVVFGYECLKVAQFSTGPVRELMYVAIDRRLNGSFRLQALPEDTGQDRSVLLKVYGHNLRLNPSEAGELIEQSDDLAEALLVMPFGAALEVGCRDQNSNQHLGVITVEVTDTGAVEVHTAPIVPCKV